MAPKTFDEMVAAMLLCEQTQGQSVYQHGSSVRKHFYDLVSLLKDNEASEAWKIPDWLREHKEQILENLHDQSIIDLYLLYHDCGKPFSKIVDSEGKTHFPDHANVSKEIWLSVGGDPVIGDLIGWDMDFHTLSAEEIAERFETWTIKDACTLLLAALAEIHSNAKMFGGISSISFKSKWKKIERRGKQLCGHYFSNILHH